MQRLAKTLDQTAHVRSLIKSLHWVPIPSYTFYWALARLLVIFSVVLLLVMNISRVTKDRRQSKTLLTIDRRGSKPLEIVFSNAICRQSGDKW